MRKSLFSLENADSSPSSDEPTTSPEEGEASGALIDAGDDSGEIGEYAEALDTGADAADQMGEVEDLVATAVNGTEGGEGITPVAAEAIRIAIEAICSRVDAKPTAVYSLYAAENFQAPSARKANGGYALEGVGQVAKDFYARMKAALGSMWEKIQSFWANHISTLGRVKKALESMKSKVASSSGKFEGRAQLDEAPSALIDAFPGSGRLDKSAIDKFVTAHKTATGTSKAVTDKVSKFNDTSGVDIFTSHSATVTGIFADAQLGTSSAPLVSGVYITYKVEGGASEEDRVTIESEREVISDKETKRALVLGEKGDVKSLLDSTLAIINETIKVKDSVTKLQDATNKMLNAAEKALNDFDKSGDGFKKARANLSKAYKVNSKGGAISGEMLSQNIRLAKGVIAYASICLKHYK